jgi:hypothetical protein
MHSRVGAAAATKPIKNSTGKPTPLTIVQTTGKAFNLRTGQEYMVQSIENKTPIAK